MNFTLLHHKHHDLNARMGEFGGWEMPIQYKGILSEHDHTRKKCSIFDICHMGEIELSGPGCINDLEKLLTCNIRGMSIGQVRYGYLLNHSGGVIDDLTCYRLADEKFMLVVNAATTQIDFDWFKKNISPKTFLVDRSSEFAKIDIQGPLSKNILIQTANLNITDLKYFKFIEIDKIIVSRTGYTGELGYELYIPSEQVEKWWDMLLNHVDCEPAGLGARDTLRLEMGYPLYGHELNELNSPISFSNGSFINLDKDFIGKNKIINDLENKSKKAVGLLFDSKRAARENDLVFHKEKEIGIVSSGSISPSLGKAIAIASVKSEYSNIGKKLLVKIRNNFYEAEVVSLPFYSGGTARI